MTTRLWLRDDLRDWCGDRDPFRLMLELEGEAVREVAERSTIRITLAGRVFYVKRHYGVGWLEILKNLITGKRPVLDAGNEYMAVERLRAIGIASIPVAGFGVQGWNPARRRSFLISDELKPVISLEQYCLHWPERPPPMSVRVGLIRRVAKVARSMHQLGINHQDFYICHFLLGTQAPLTAESVVSVPLYLVDLHRAGAHASIPRRALLKDLAGLYYSTFDIDLSERDILRFLRAYFDLPIRRILREHGGLLADCRQRALQLYEKAKRKGILPRQLAGLDSI